MTANVIIEIAHQQYLVVGINPFLEFFAEVIEERLPRSVFTLDVAKVCEMLGIHGIVAFAGTDRLIAGDNAQCCFSLYSEQLPCPVAKA